MFAFFATVSPAIQDVSYSFARDGGRGCMTPEREEDQAVVDVEVVAEWR